MALLYIDGFETFTTISQRWAAATAASISSSPPAGRTGSAMTVNDSLSVARDLGVSPSEVVVGFAFHATATNPNGRDILGLNEGATNHLSLRFTGAASPYKLDLYRGGTLLQAGSINIATGTWVYVELRAKVHDTTGTAHMKISGVTDFNITGQDTRNGGTGVVSRLYFGGWAGVTYHDDLYLCDVSGSANNDFLGDVKVETIRPTAAGNSTQFTPSAGSNWQNVDDAAPNDDTDYNSSSTNGHIDLFTLGNLTTSSGTVQGIQVNNRWRKDDAGSRASRRVIRTGSTDYEGADVTMLDSYVTTCEVVEQNPNTTAAWTIADVNGLEAGYKLQS